MMRGSKAVIMAGVLLMAISGCSKSDVKTVAIDGHVFSVPKKYLIQGTIPWLPESQHDGLMFVINPEAPLPEQNSVLIQSTSITCHPQTAPAYDQLASACEAAERGFENEAAEPRLELEKFYENKGDPWWTYRLKDPGGKGPGATVASCSALANGNGLCHALSNYGGLVYTVSLRDSEIARLPAIRRKVHELLSSWEKPAH